MITVEQAEARVVKGEAAIRAREASGRAVPPARPDAYNEAWVELLAMVSAAQERAQAGALRQGRISISAGVR